MCRALKIEMLATSRWDDHRQRWNESLFNSKVFRSSENISDREDRVRMQQAPRDCGACSRRGSIHQVYFFLRGGVATEPGGSRT
jgi:hypothetical protein